MFEIDIRIAALEGVELHEQDGTVYWKLLKTCPECGKVMDDECMCFSTKEAMEKAKVMVFYCSAKCWYVNQSIKDQMEQIEYFKQAADEAGWHLSGDEVRRLPQSEFLEEMYEFINDEWENACSDTMSEACEADLDCPI